MVIQALQLRSNDNGSTLFRIPLVAILLILAPIASGAFTCHSRTGESFRATRKFEQSLPDIRRSSLSTDGEESEVSLSNQVAEQDKVKRRRDHSQVLETANDVARKFGVRPGSTAPRIVWKYSWRLLGYCLPILHLFDKARSKDLDYSLKCLWCKALSGRDKTSPAFDDYYSYDMLPSGARWLLKLPNFLFPRLIHFNIELRTTFLDRALRDEIEHVMQSQSNGNSTKIRLITLGAGYDTRSTRFLEEGLIHEAYELDMDAVIQSKSVMLERLSKRRSRRRGEAGNSTSRHQQLLTQDLNDLTSFEEKLEQIIAKTESLEEDSRWHNIFLFEGVLIYLDKGVPISLVKLCSTLLERTKQEGSLVFADLFRDLGSDFRVDTARDYFNSKGGGWKLVPSFWCPKPGLARHMGKARLGLLPSR